MFNSIDSSVSCLDHNIQGNKGGLEAGKLNQHLNSLLVVGLQPFQLLSTLGKPGKLIAISSILNIFYVIVEVRSKLRAIVIKSEIPNG